MQWLLTDNVTEYNCLNSALIQKLNAVVAASDDVRANSEHLLNSPNIRAKIKDVNSEKYLNMINKLVEKNKDVIANKLCELGKAHEIKHRINTPSRTRYLLDILKTKSYLPETYLIDNYLVTYCHLLKISFLNI